MESIRKNGALLGSAAKEAKNCLKGPLSDPHFIKLISFSRIACTDEGLVLEDGAGDTILLGESHSIPPTLDRLLMLSSKELLEDQVLLGGFYYDPDKRRLMLKPLSIITANRVVRLLY